MTDENDRRERPRSKSNVVPLRKSGPLMPAPKKGVSLAFGLDELHGEFIIRYPDGTERLGEGAVEGTIAEAPRGDGGFGYDSVFVPVEGDGSTFAEMAPEAKNALSHRSRAFAALLVTLEDPAGR